MSVLETVKSTAVLHARRSTSTANVSSDPHCSPDWPRSTPSGRMNRIQPGTGADPSIRLLGKWGDMADQFPCPSAHGPDVAARATVIDNVAVAHRQKPDHITVARWTLRDYCHRSNRRKSRPSSERTLRRRFSMTKRNAHASQRRYTKLLAWASALTAALRHFGHGVTGRPPWSLELGM